MLATASELDYLITCGVTCGHQQKGDSSAKGTIDLTAARIDPGDEKTNMPFTIRIAEAKQWFSYLQASTADECEAWLASLRKCAGYKVEKPVPTSLPKVCDIVFLLNRPQGRDLTSLAHWCHYRTKARASAALA